MIIYILCLKFKAQRTNYTFIFKKASTHHPLTTPSTLSIGTILNTYLARSAAASAEAASRQASVPSITHDALLSPGCTRADSNIISLSWGMGVHL